MSNRSGGGEDALGSLLSGFSGLEGDILGRPKAMSDMKKQRQALNDFDALFSGPPTLTAPQPPASGTSLMDLGVSASPDPSDPFGMDLACPAPPSPSGQAAWEAGASPSDPARPSPRAQASGDDDLLPGFPSSQTLASPAAHRQHITAESRGLDAREDAQPRRPAPRETSPCPHPGHGIPWTGDGASEARSPSPPGYLDVAPHALAAEVKQRAQRAFQGSAAWFMRAGKKLQESARAREGAEAAEKAGCVALRDTLGPEMETWTAGKRDNIRALLSTMHTVLWPDSGWERPSISDMVEDAKVKRWYMKANLVVHPDKVRQKGGVVEAVARADMVFDILKAAWGKFEAARAR
ncbi:Auxilin-related protein 2 [Auxenochlorella protothecoides]|uniref:Auxilin-related protein 2 n=1 Tax=Auxenochlorella protothecoides TaxID=3075 RepID=A0A087SDH2_AUXPR|nr:Auxilin-related protein 2 [Auxenochlorella protothecoides]KFM23776.1 Auxilin-related protein 2 [Auxenochlorella protothecoides]